MAGCPFLAAALKEPVTELLESGRSLELDPALSPLELANRAPDLVSFAADIVEVLRATLHLFLSLHSTSPTFPHRGRFWTQR